jgi:RNase P protein component
MQTRTLRFNYEFSRIYRKGKFAAGHYVVVHYLRRPGSPGRVGVTVVARSMAAFSATV